MFQFDAQVERIQGQPRTIVLIVFRETLDRREFNADGDEFTTVTFEQNPFDRPVHP